MTISPPSNVREDKNIPCQVLSHGVDTLVLALDIFWKSEVFFQALAELRTEAEESEEPVTGKIAGPEGEADWVFCISPYGKEGYQWMLTSEEYSLKVGNWLAPQTRPSVMVEIRSETLWIHGVDESVQRVLGLLRQVGGRIEMVKLSRIDLCVDLLMPDELWRDDIRHHCNTRARKIDPHYSNLKLTGFSIGRGDISARLYDKWLEITEKSQKWWMMDIWGDDVLLSIADGYKAIRTEFQLRRTALRELGINEYEQLEAGLPYIWHTCTNKWLKLVDDVDKHPARQKLLPWWSTVQDGFAGSQQATPLIRAKAISEEKDRLVNQLMGFVAAITGLHLQGEQLAKDEVLDVQSHVQAVIADVCTMGWDDVTFTQKVKQNQAKRIRHEEKFAQASRIRTALGLSLERIHNRETPHHD
jgi:hypothetical protein